MLASHAAYGCITVQPYIKQGKDAAQIFTAAATIPDVLQITASTASSILSDVYVAANAYVATADTAATSVTH